MSQNSNFLKVTKKFHQYFSEFSFVSKNNSFLEFPNVLKVNELVFKFDNRFLILFCIDFFSKNLPRIQTKNLIEMFNFE